MARKLFKDRKKAPDWPVRPTGASDVSVSVDLKDWVVWPKNTFQKMFEDAIHSEQANPSDGEHEANKIEIDKIISAVSEDIASVSKSIAKQIYEALPQDRFSYLVEYDQTNCSQNVLISRIWGPSVEYAKYQYFIARDAFSYVAANHMGRLRKERQEAVGSITTRSLLVFREIITLCEAGYPDGAMARWRTLYELQVILCALSAIKGRSYEYFIAAEAITNLRYIEAVERRKNNQVEVDNAIAELKRIQDIYGKQIAEDYGWAAISLGKKRINFRDLEQIAKHDFQRAEYRFASRLIHGNHFEYISLLGYPEWSGARGPLIGPSPYGIEIVLQEAVRTLAFITIEILSIKNTLDTMILMHISAINKNKFDRISRKSARMMNKHTKNINENWGM